MKALKSQRYLSTWIQYLVVIILTLGVLIRFTNLDQKTLWFDEAYTPLQASGYTERDVFDRFSDARIIKSSDLQQYLRPDPKGSFIDTIRSFAIEDPQHTPLYYVMTRVWMQWFGNSVTALRSLPAVLSLLTFPCIYWLCLELFSLPVIGWIAVGLVSISPLHVLYAQEAREYTLWIVMTLASSAALLRAMRLETTFSWMLYALTVALSLYSFIFSAFVLLGHGIYVVTLEKFRLNKRVQSYLVALLLGLLPFLPWLLIIVTNFSQVQATSVTNILDISKPPLRLLVEWLQEVRLVFLDLDVGLQTPLLYRLINIAFLAIFPLFVTVAFYSLCRNLPRRVWLFVLILTGATFLPLAIVDLVSGGARSTTPRYIFPFCLGVQLAFAYLIANRFEKAVSAWRQRVWCAIVAAVIFSGIVSCVLFSQAETWWTKGQLDFLGAAQVINQAKQPILMGRASLAEMMALSYQFNPNVQLLMQLDCFNCTKDAVKNLKPSQLSIPANFENIFVFQAHPQEGWLNEFQNGKDYQAVPLLYKNKPLVDYEGSRFWQLVKQP